MTATTDGHRQEYKEYKETVNGVTLIELIALNMAHFLPK